MGKLLFSRKFAITRYLRKIDSREIRDGDPQGPQNDSPRNLGKLPQIVTMGTFILLWEIRNYTLFTIKVIPGRFRWGSPGRIMNLREISGNYTLSTGKVISGKFRLGVPQLPEIVFWGIPCIGAYFCILP